VQCISGQEQVKQNIPKLANKSKDTMQTQIKVKNNGK
jgi:hypothetical protein